MSQGTWLDHSARQSIPGLCLVLLVLVSPLALAHATIEERIASATQQLAASPENVELYLLRGELYASHQQWRAAEADFKKVIGLDESEFEVHLYLGRMFLAENRPTEAAQHLGRYLARKPRHSAARVTMAQIYVALNRPLEAAEEYSLAIKYHASPTPNWYLQRAQLLSTAEPEKLDKALLELDRGIARYGPLAILQLYAISLEERRQHYDAALLRLDSLAQQSARRETWLQRRAEILHKAGRDAQALETSAAAQTALRALPQSRKNNKAMRELDAQIIAFRQCVTTLGSLCSN